METLPHNLTNLFLQLGLSSSAADINAFVARHRLTAGISLCQAPFWSPAQAQFLTQTIREDSDWSESADQLAVLLSMDYSRHPPSTMPWASCATSGG